MSVASELTALEGFMTSAYSKISDKGGTVPQNKNMQNLTNAIDSIPTGSIIIIPPDAGTLTSLSVTTAPTTTVYIEGEYFDFSGLVITATYSSGQQFNVTNSCTYIMNQPLQYGDTSITAQYESLSATISITVNAVPVPAPATTTFLYHYNNNLINEVTGVADSATVSYASGKFEQGLVTPNNTNYQVTLNWSHSSLLADNYTFEFWIKRASGNNYSDNVWAQIGPSNAYYDYIFTSDNISSVGLKMSTSGFASSCTVDNIPSNFNITAWNHIAIVISAGTYKVFLNGILACHGNIKLTNGFIKFAFKKESANTYIDECLICNSAKYTTDFVPNNAPYYIETTP